MNSTPGILYNIGDKIVCAEREMPINDGSSYYYDRSIYFEDIDSYELALKSWLKDCKDVVNYCHRNRNKNEYQIKLPINKPLSNFTIGQKCLFVPEGDKVRVTELLNK